MFSKAIFKQTLKSNWKLWAVFTGVLAAMTAMMFAVFDDSMIEGMKNMVEQTPMMADMAGDRLANMTSVLGMIGQSLYGNIGVILPLVFIIITANSLIASQVDRGSMAYLLSTPTKRATVVRTQAVYLISSIVAMVSVVTIVGLGSVQLFHHGIWAQKYTDDVTAAAKVLNIDKKDVSEDLGLIIKNDEALKSGAEARDLSVDEYQTYLGIKINGEPETAETQDPKVAEQMQNSITAGITAAAAKLDTSTSNLVSDMSKIKDDDEAMKAAAEASKLPPETWVGLINSQIASNELKEDKGMDFDVAGYIRLNVGFLSLLFAVSSISFFFSCVFNLTKYSMMFGAGIPIAFFVFEMLAKASESLEFLKYLSLNTLFNTDEIIAGGSYVWQFVILGVTGVVLYVAGGIIFKRKDLPL